MSFSSVCLFTLIYLHHWFCRKREEKFLFEQNKKCSMCCCRISLIVKIWPEWTITTVSSWLRNEKQCLINCANILCFYTIVFKSLVHLYLLARFQYMLVVCSSIWLKLVTSTSTDYTRNHRILSKTICPLHIANTLILKNCACIFQNYIKCSIIIKSWFDFHGLL